MSEDKMDNPQDLKAASRRSRKDQQGRDFVCGCGKGYLSYPALYTHIKTKHQGQQPEGTQKTGIIPSNKRVKPKVDDKFLKQIENLVQIDNLTILNHLDQNARGIVPLNSRIKKQNLSKQLIQCYSLIIRNNSSLTLDKKSSLQLVLICYLIGAGQYVSDSLFYQYYCSFARLFSNCFRQYAQEVYDVCFKNQNNRQEKTINLQQCRMVPIICDFFLRFYIPYEKKDADFLSVMQVICFDFCQWMYAHKLTIVQVSLKKVCQIRKNLIEPKNKDKNNDQLREGQQDRQSPEHENQQQQFQSQKQENQKQMAQENNNQMQNASSMPQPEQNRYMKSQSENSPNQKT